MKCLRILCVTFACVRVLAGATPLRAGTIRHDREDALYTDLAAQPAYACVGAVMRTKTSGPIGAASGVLISGNWVLTAAHVVQSSSLTGVSVDLNGVSYEADDWIVHPDWDGNVGHGNDLALIHLVDGVQGIDPALLTGDSVGAGDIATLAGFGQTGTGLTGSGGPRGTKRAGRNRIDGTGIPYGLPATVLLADFDDPRLPNSGALDLEYMVAPGDSGGGWFVEIDGRTVLVGISSFIFALDGEADSDYGDVMAATCVSGYIEWIDSHGALVPEPTSLSMIGVLVMTATVARWRRRCRR